MYLQKPLTCASILPLLLVFMEKGCLWEGGALQIAHSARPDYNVPIMAQRHIPCPIWLLSAWVLKCLQGGSLRA